jgi:hypothetical protein
MLQFSNMMPKSSFHSFWIWFFLVILQLLFLGCSLWIIGIWQVSSQNKILIIFHCLSLYLQRRCRQGLRNFWRCTAGFKINIMRALNSNGFTELLEACWRKEVIVCICWDGPRNHWWWWGFQRTEKKLALADFKIKSLTQLNLTGILADMIYVNAANKSERMRNWDRMQRLNPLCINFKWSRRSSTLASVVRTNLEIINCTARADRAQKGWNGGADGQLESC